VEKLRAMGHSVTSTRQGDAHTIYVDPKTGAITGAEDRRIMGKSAGF
jgi:gamma-glutamyltranspeptidase/glutathione hydrolase